MLSVKQELLAALAGELDKLSPGAAGRAAFESPKVAAHGDFACTAAMQLAKPLKLNPRALGEQLKAALEATPAFARWVDAIEIAGPGFLNIRLKAAAKQEIVREVLAAGDRFGYQKDNGQRVLVEFVSANPTGPLHVGHGRQAALGDAICNLFATQGWSVHREYYYNDAGVQIETLAKSTQLRAKGFKPGDECWPTDPENPASKAFYNGEYIQDIANDFLAKKTVQAEDRAFTANGDVEDYDNIRQFAVAYLRNEQDKDLRAFNLHFDQYYLESSLYTSGRVEATVKRLVEKGHTYEQDGALWLRSTDYGDDKDRVMRKKDGTYTYFVPDVAYHISKWERGFAKVVNIQGTDHHGTIARVRAGLQAADVGIPQGYPDYVLHTMVRVVKGGEEVKISKRAGSYVTLRDLIEWTSKDAVRFFLLSRKPDTEYTFDVDLAVAQNNDNPVYYVQYAHARIQSVLRAAVAHARGDRPDVSGGQLEKLSAPDALNDVGEHVTDTSLSSACELLDLGNADLSPLEGQQAQALMLQLAKYPEMLAAAAEGEAPHDVTFYLRDLAASYHSYYDAERILVDDEAVKRARLALVAATAQVLHNGLAVLGVSAPARM
ncbi:arginyl-tRNA synthetase [Paracidovorax avenae ATCC 19860]|uniref:Arginine--tRNA ligase n=1 Tax=Paracidovorax avenae (strain ATCC 19860 / DSM 7227 / CCUG 15838 / JCM 20985 / LMG 2117 / NCPPB 1011) TaxID=643561 RepID=F0Q599_PARA1|nr:arginine--tRNA ligase [Paracidovorax avenae]ADX44398.1 arginyl-tRNA synthetase [Paracidovorax avenae ATCC 19860]